MARVTLKLKRPITQVELDLDENSLEAVGFMRMSEAKTNGDKIRAMSDEELAKKMSGLESFALTCGGGWPPEKWLDWLKSPVEVDNG